MIRKLFLWFRNKYLTEKPKPYKLPLEELIKRTTRRMKLKPICPHCNNEMSFRLSKIHVTSFPIRDDIAYKCTNCFHTCHFGIPITKKEALKEIDLRGSPYLNNTSYREDEQTNTEVIKRLKALGYIE